MLDADYAKEWVEIAERDYAVALFLNENFHPLPTENICYGCQQSVEKSLKAILAYNEAKIPHTHDIELLQELCKAYTDAINMDMSITRALTRFATESRYPDSAFDFTKEDAELGLEYAKLVLNKVKEVLRLT